MGGLSIWHWLVVGVIILLLFGKGRFSEMMGDVAKGLKSFKAGIADDEEEERRKAELQRSRLGSSDRPIDVTPNPRVADPVAPPPPPPPGQDPRV